MASTKAELIEVYASDIKEKFGETPDMDLLGKVATGLGPAIFNLDARYVSYEESELETVKKNFLIKKLGLEAGSDLDEAVEKVMETYGHSNREKHRAVVYYMLAKHFGKESIYN